MKQFEKSFMEALAAFVIRFHKIILSVSLILVILSILASSQIVSKTEIKDLLPENNPQVQSYEEINDTFTGGATVSITIEGKDKDKMIACADTFVKQIEADPKAMKGIRAINLKTDKDFTGRWDLLLQKTKDLRKNKLLFRDLNLLPFLTHLNDSFEETYMGDGSEELETRKQENDAVALLTRLETFFSLLHDYIQRPGAYSPEVMGNKLADTFMFGDGYNFNWDGTYLLFSITPDFNTMEIEKIRELMTEIKGIQQKVQSQYPMVRVAYSGDVAIQADEADALGFDMLVPSLVAIVLIFILFLFSFKPLRTILFAVASLIIAIIFTYGFLGVTIREVNMFTSILAVLLVGLGIDYGIQIITNYNMYREGGAGPAEALRLTFVNAGMGTLLAALTTAVGFFVMAATGTRAFTQFGLVMGAGIIICFITMLFILPSFIILLPKKNLASSRFPALDYKFLVSLGTVTCRFKWPLAAGCIVVTGFLIFASTFNTMEYDTMKLEPEDMPSIVEYKRIMDKFNVNPSTSLVIANSLDEAREFTQALEKEKSVVSVNSLASFLPADDEQDERLRELAEIRTMPVRYTSTRYTSASIEQFLREIQRLEWNVVEIGDLSVAGLGEENKIVKKRNAMIHEVIGAEKGKPGKEVFQKLMTVLSRDPELSASQLMRLDLPFAQAMNTSVGKMASINRKITINDIPESITRNLLNADGKRSLIIIYPQENVLDDMHKMEWFNSRMARISPRITGVTQINTALQKEFLAASIKAGLFIFIVVFIFILITFRNLKHSLLAIVPLLLGIIWMLGLYPLFGFRMNAFNIAVIPLVIGMGVDYGIHLLHRFGIEKNIEGTYRSTGKAVFLSALTTMIGFGSLALMGTFVSVALIGVILFLGITTCLIAALVILPALIAGGSRKTNV